MTRAASTDPASAEIGELVFAQELPSGVSMVECLRVAWDEARWDARAMYDLWHWHGGVEGYVAYRAARDRADAAQDALAKFALAESARAL
jgi:hypothetical protein